MLEPLAVKHLPTCNKVAEQSIFQGSKSSCSANSSTYSIGGSERSEANASSLKIPMHNVPLDNLSSKTSTSVKNDASDSYIGGIPSPQSAQILVPSALNLNAPLQVSLPQAAMTSPHSSYSNTGKFRYATLISSPIHEFIRVNIVIGHQNHKLTFDLTSRQPFMSHCLRKYPTADSIKW